jgi:hypothetical protein
MSVVNISKANLKKLGYNSLEDWMKNPNHVYIGRPIKYIAATSDAKYGNPFPVEKYGRNKCIELYHEYLLDNPDKLQEVLKLKHKVLGCWCKPERCHGDVILELIKKNS